MSTAANYPDIGQKYQLKIIFPWNDRFLTECILIPGYMIHPMVFIIFCRYG